MKTKVIMALSECNYEPEITEFENPYNAWAFVVEKMKDGSFKPLHTEKVEKSMQYVTMEGFVAVVFVTQSEKEEKAAMTSIEEYMADLEEDDDMFDECANKSVAEIKQMVDNNADEEIIRQSVRYWLSRRLAFDGNEIDCNITIEADGTMGLSTLQMPVVTKVTMDKTEGYITISFEATEETLDLDDLSVNEMIQLIEGLDL